MKKQHKILARCCGLLLIAGAVAGCHTTEGLGKDVSQTGKAMGMPFK